MSIQKLIDTFSNVIINKSENFLHLKFSLNNDKILVCLTNNFDIYEISILNRIGEFGYLEYNKIPDDLINNTSTKVTSKVKINEIENYLINNGIKN